MPTRTPIPVVLAEDNALLRQGLARLIAHSEDMDLVGEATDLPSLQAAVAEKEPAVVITDIRMPPTKTDEGITFAAKLRAERPDIGVVLLSQHAEATYALRLLEGGASGRAYLLKERVGDVAELTSAVKAVADGGSVIDPTVVEQLVAANTGPKDTPLKQLTPREREVLSEISQGKSNAAIAATLFLSERAVEKHTNSIFSKLHISDERDLNRRVSAVLLFLHEGGGR